MRKKSLDLTPVGKSLQLTTRKKKRSLLMRLVQPLRFLLSPLSSIWSNLNTNQKISIMGIIIASAISIVFGILALS